MKPAKNIEKHIKNIYVESLPATTSAELDERVLGNVMEALEESKKKDSTAIGPNTWRIIMKSRITKLAAAAVIIIAILFGLKLIGGPDMANVAWAEIVKKVEQSHDEYMKKLLLAAEEKDTEKIEFYADLLSEFWQNLGRLAKTELYPERRARILAEIAGLKPGGRSDQIGVQIFLEYSDQFSNWLGKIEDVAWINETIHVCKQMEEYAEEIREPARHPELDFSYIEHCLPSFITYCEWFEQLPLDNPEQYMMPPTLLAGIQRDLQIARRELEALQIRDADRFVKRCLQQAQKNVLDLDKKTASSRTEKQRDLCRKLTQRIDHLSELLTYAIIARWDIQQTYEVDTDEAFGRVLRKEFGGTEPFGDFFLDQIEQSLDLCKELSQNFESKQ
ncbi:MAG: hypothetical protein ACYSWZ_22315 [Planctomycetota bacterium]|jgi:hypothetical protein